MKKTVFLLVLSALTVSLYAQSITNRHLFIEGTAENDEHHEFFLNIFTIEARTGSYILTRRKQDAAHTFQFAVTPNMVMINGSEQPAPPGDNQFALKITLLENKNNREILSFDFYFTELIETYDFSQILFQRAALYIPPITTADAIDRRWQNKWLYLRTSIDYPITFYHLQPEGLVGGRALYEGTRDDPGEINILDNIIFPQPGATIGLEFQFLKFMSLETNVQINLGDTQDLFFPNFSTGAELKFNIKTRYLMLQPYGTFIYHLNKSEQLFTDFPPFSAGGGMQIATRGGSSGSFFVNMNFTYSFDDVVMINQYAQLFPNPDEIYYNRFMVGLGVGYKLGLFNRRR